MPNPRLPEEVAEAVKNQWGLDPKQRAKAVRAEVEKLGHRVSIRKVQQIVAELKRLGAGPMEVQLWRPWKDSTETPAETVDLISISLKWKEWWNRELGLHEAKWWRRLRQALPPTPPIYLATLTALYAQREMVASNLNEPAVTDDLDPLLFFIPWASREQLRTYKQALEIGTIDEPRLTEVIAIGSRDGNDLKFVKGLDALLLQFVWAKDDVETLRDQNRDLPWQREDYKDMIAKSEGTDSLRQFSDEGLYGLLEMISGEAMNQDEGGHIERQHPTTNQE